MHELHNHILCTVNAKEANKSIEQRFLSGFIPILLINYGKMQQLYLRYCNNKNNFQDVLNLYQKFCFYCTKVTCVISKIVLSYTHRARRGYWENIKPSSGRPFSSSMSKPDDWGVTQGDKDLIQHKETTTQEEMDSVINRATNKEVVNGSN